MNLQRVLVLTTLAAAAAMPAQAQAPVAAASVPDFSGIWGHLTWPDFEPPLTGPGPVTNL